MTFSKNLNIITFWHVVLCLLGDNNMCGNWGERQQYGESYSYWEFLMVIRKSNIDEDLLL